MDTWSDVATNLMRCTLIFSISVLTVGLLLKRMPRFSPNTQRMAWCLVLAQSWLLIPLTIAVPLAIEPTEQPRLLQQILSVTGTLAAEPLNAEQPVSATTVDPHSTPPRASSGDPIEQATAPPSQLTWLSLFRWGCTLLVAGWIVGALVALVRQGCAYLSFVRSYQATSDVHDSWLAEWRLVCRQLGTGDRIGMIVTQHHGPCLCMTPRGYRVLIPSVTWRQLAPAQRISILRHELAHYQRLDLWVTLLARFLALPQWFNPAARYALRQVDQCTEWGCDELAKRNGVDEFDLATAILFVCGGNRKLAPSVLSASGGSVRGRIQRLIDPHPYRESRRGHVLLASTIALLAALGLCRVQLTAAPTSLLEEAAQTSETDAFLLSAYLDPAGISVTQGDFRPFSLMMTENLVVPEDQLPRAIQCALQADRRRPSSQVRFGLFYAKGDLSRMEDSGKLLSRLNHSWPFKVMLGFGGLSGTCGTTAPLGTRLPSGAIFVQIRPRPNGRGLVSMNVEFGEIDDTSLAGFDSGHPLGRCTLHDLTIGTTLIQITPRYQLNSTSGQRVRENQVTITIWELCEPNQRLDGRTLVW